jgi:DNA-binding GntR family transcriptional regulator
MDRKSQASFGAVHAAIFGRIAQGQYRPTRRIGVAELAEMLGVSTTPVREALRHLAGRDLVVERHREGFYLAPLGAQAIASLYAAHDTAMDRALAAGAGRGRTGRHGPRSLWRLFETSASLTGDYALVAVRRYLDDRLAVLRRQEAMLLGDLATRAIAFGQALAAQDVIGARAVSKAFHKACIQDAESLASAFDPQT